MHYEANPSLAPTLAYFGCSKKACFLCQEYLALSPLKPGVRGTHGVCHPNWAVLPSSKIPGELAAYSARLRELCNIIKSQIHLHLQPGPRLPRRNVPQSSAVSELKTADMVQLGRRAAIREAAQKTAVEDREGLQILFVELI
jgi:hypothetical protein